MSDPFRVAVVQHNPTVGDVEGNATRLASEIEGAAASGADLVVAPELAVLGYPPRDLLYRTGVLRAQRRAVESLAGLTEDGPPVVLGATRPLEVTAEPLSNAALLLRDGAVATSYAKRLLPTYDVFDEHRYFRPGAEPTVVEVGDTAVGLSVCEDAWNDVRVAGRPRHDADPLADLAAAGADLIVTVSASPFSLGKPARRLERFSGHAERTGCPVVFANQVGANDDLVFDGHSMVVGADGELRRRLDGFGAETAVVDVGSAGDDRPDAASRAVQARRALRLGVSDYFRKTRFDRAVVGMSGGIDSSVTAALAVDALGAEAVHGVSLPSAVTSDRSREDAATVADRLGIDFDAVPIEAAREALAADLTAAGIEPAGVAAENLQARLRGAALMAIANQEDALVLTPDNKSEAAVGYCTLYGDTVGALAPLGDCYKHLVYELAARFNDDPPADTEPPIPESVIEKAPTAELRADQTDSDDLPPYEALDPLLEAYVGGTATGSGLREDHAEADVEDVLGRLTRAEFKRWQTPPPLRITRSAFNRGWRYPIAAEYRHVLGD